MSRLFFQVLFLVTGCFLTLGCGGLDWENTPSQKPLQPERWLTGEWLGYAVFMDRNGNTVETALIHRNCEQTKRGLRGACQDRVHYQSRAPEERQRLLWSLEYGGDGTASVVFLESAGAESFELTGRMRGSMLFLRGRKWIPLAAAKTARVEARYLALPGPAEPVLQMENYSAWGLAIGSAQIFWVRENKK